MLLEFEYRLCAVRSTDPITVEIFGPMSVGDFDKY